MQKSKWLAASSLLGVFVGLSSAAYAQTTDQLQTPEKTQFDERGVDLTSGKFFFSSREIDIGDGTGTSGLFYERTQRQGGYDDNFVSSLSKNADGTFSVQIGDTVERFPAALGKSLSGTGAQLSLEGSYYFYTSMDGSRYRFDAAARSEIGIVATHRVTVYKTSDSRVINIGYDTRDVSLCPNGVCKTYRISRPVTVQSSDGYRLTLLYHMALNSTELDANNVGIWFSVASVTASNATNTACLPSTCGPDHPVWRSAKFGVGNTETRTDPEGRTTLIRRDSQKRIVGVTLPGASAETFTVGYDASGRVTSYATDGRTWSYAYSTNASAEQVTTVTAPSGLQTVATTNTTTKLITSYRVGSGGTTRYEYYTDKTLKAVVNASGVRTEYTRDGRGNAITTTVTATSGEQIITRATYATCTAGPACNKPLTTTDERGQVTTYEYDPNYGGIKTITYPADGKTNQQRKRVYTYQNLTATYATGSGRGPGTSISKLTQITECATATTCAGGAAEAVTDIAYDPNNNLRISSVTRRSGDRSVISTKNIKYNVYGDVMAEESPRGADSTTYKTFYRYNKARQVVGIIAPDPDDTGAARRTATRISYDGAGRVASSELGSVVTSSNIEGEFPDADWQAFQSLRKTDIGYSASSKKTSETTAINGKQAVTYYSYDSDLRAMGSTVQAKLPGDTLFPSGPDQTIGYRYGANGAIATVLKNGVTAERYTYRANGQVETVKDSKDNVTTYNYDGFDRLIRTTYPDGSFEYLNLARSGDVESVRLRNALSISYGRDLLGRITSQTIAPDATSPTAASESNRSFGYDLFGRLTAVSNANGQALWTNSTTISYDALDRVTSEGTNLGGTGVKTMSYQYDAADNRIRVTWPDGFFATYDYDFANRLTAVRENGGFVLGTMTYDDFSRPKAISRGNGTVTNYTFDSLSRLAALSQDLAGTAADITYGTTFDLAGREMTQTRSNDAYAWKGHTAADRSYGINGLNQYTSVEGTPMEYDTRGNLTKDGKTNISYQYDRFGQLIGSSSGAKLAYDGAGRLSYTALNGASVTRYGYIGDQLAAEYDANGTITKRHVPIGVDTYLVTYGPSGREYYQSDERGSVVAITDDSGNPKQILAYDEFGIPGGNYAFRFQYTGQAWLNEIGMSYYKTRVYSPTLGRFMQPDPIGYDAGLNRYNYTESDPINMTDATGLAACGQPGHYESDGTWNIGTGTCAPSFDFGFWFSPGSGGGGSYYGGGASGGGGNGSGDTGSFQDIAYMPDRCANKATPSLAGKPAPFTVDRDQLYSKSQEKFLQHSFPISPSGRAQSTFGGVITSGEKVASGAAFLITTRNAVPAGSINSRITGDVGVNVGRDVLSLLPNTTYMTVIVGPPIGLKNGMPLRPLVSVYPGC